MKKVAFHNLGCKVNAYETEAMKQQFYQRGYSVAEFGEDTGEPADIYIINTCTVTAVADQKSRQMLHRAKRFNPDACVVAVGCFVEAADEAALKDEAIDLCIGNVGKSEIVDRIEKYLEEKNTASRDRKAISGENVYEEFFLQNAGEHTRSYVKIQDGCNQFCSYCIIPYARGRVRSRKPEDILQEAKNLSLGGVKELVITGIHISSYGTDWGEEGLIDLLERLNAMDELGRMRLGSLEPKLITEEFVRRTAGLTKLCPHFHLSLQSGCDRTLKRMNRKYTAEEYMAGVELLRRYYDNPAITTDIIAGFPEETEEDFAESYNFVESVNFLETHIFKYSPRKGTPACSMKQCTNRVKSDRSHRLIELGQKKKMEYLRTMVGRQAEVLVEGEKNHGDRILVGGYTERYCEAVLGDDLYGHTEPNTLVRGIVREVLPEGILLL